MVFGTFDVVHDGHRHLLQQAADMGEEVIIVVSRDEHVLELKGRLPINQLEDRLEAISCESEVTTAVAGDLELGSYGVLTEHQPDAILLGYDQDELKENLMAWMEDHGINNISCSYASAYMPHLFNTTRIVEQMQDEELSVL